MEGAGERQKGKGRKETERKADVDKGGVPILIVKKRRAITGNQC